ncbi:MAG TPA: hypothetical protein V6D00_05590 [Pantanalinema sp.]
MNIQKVALFISFTLLVGCRPAGVIQLPTTQGGASQGGALQQDAQARKGSLSIAVKWPERSLPGFNAQVIPKTTKALLLGIADANDNQVYYELIQRPEQGTDPARREIFLNEGNGYKVKVEAYEDFGEDLQTKKIVPSGKLVAKAVKTGIEIKWNQKTPVPLPLDAEYAPTISGLSLYENFLTSTDHAGNGAQLFLVGENLTWPSSGLPEVVFPSGKIVTAENADVVGSKLSFTVPEGAGSGNLFIRVNGVPSTTTSFQEIKSFTLTPVKGGEDQALDDFLGDGVIRSWLGESFPFQANGYDSSDNYKSFLKAKWSNSSAAVGAINPVTGAYQANSNGVAAFGEDTITAKTGNVTATRKVIVAPPAGTLIGLSDPDRAPGDPASNPAGGLSVAKIDDNRFIGTWFDKTDNRVHWQLFSKNGLIAATHHSTPAAFRDTIRMVRVAVQGQTAVIAYTLENGFGLVSVDLQTGAPKQTRTYDQPYRLSNLSANDNAFMVSYYGLISGVLYFNYKMLTVAGDGTINETASYYLTIRDNLGIVRAVNDSAFDTFGMTVNAEGKFVTAFHFVGDAGILYDKFIEFNDDGTMAKDASGSVRSGGGFPRSSHRSISLATNATHYLTAAVDLNTSKVKAYLYTKDGPYKAVAAKMIEVDDIGPGVSANPLDNPTSVAWNGTEFLVTYTKNVVINGESKPRPMVRAIAPDGTLKGEPQPIANLGTSPMLVPTDEGGMAFWLSSTKKLIARRLRYH